MATTANTASEACFEQYLRATGLSGWETHEPDLGVRKRPDYLVERSGERAVCEVKESADSIVHKDLMTKGDSVRDLKEVLRGLRGSIKTAAAQLKPLAGTGLSLVVVLANPHRLVLPFSVDEVGWAMYGGPRFRVPLSLTGAPGALEAWTRIHGRDGELSRNHPYVSAVALLRNAAEEPESTENWRPKGNYLCVDLLHTRSAMRGFAPPVSSALFDGAHDAHWAPTAVGEYVRLS